MDYMLGLLEKLVSINTNTDLSLNYVKCANLIAKEAKNAGLKVKTISPKAKDGRPRPNLIIEPKNCRAKEAIVAVTHYDVVGEGVGWRTNPFKVTRKGGRLFGRGVNDDKGAVAAALAAMKEIGWARAKRKVKLIVACDEEIGGIYGIRHLAENRKSEMRGDLAWVIDGPIDKIGIGCSAVGRGYIVLKGEQGHAAYPHRTENLMHKAIAFMDELKEYSNVVAKRKSRFNGPPDSPDRGKVWGRFAITIAKAGFKFNVFPHEAVIGFDFRALPEDNVKVEFAKLRKHVKKLLKKHRLKAELREWSASPGYFTDEKNKLVKEFAKAAERAYGKKLKFGATLGADDGRFLAKNGIPTIGFAPGGKNPHGSNESVTIGELGKVKLLMKELASG